MKIHSLILLLFALSSAHLFAERSDEVQKLVQSRAKQIAEADRKFSAGLERLKAESLKNGDAESANLVAAIEEQFRSGSSASARDTRWNWESGGELVLKANGEATHTEWGRPGMWSLNQDGSIKLVGPGGDFRITFRDGEGQVFHLATGGRTKITAKKPVSGRGAAQPESAESLPTIGSIIRHLPETITPLTAEQLKEKVPVSYYFEYPYPPQPGTRVWRRVDDRTWHEVYPDGHTTVFKVLGHAKVSGTEGTMVVRWPAVGEKKKMSEDGGLQAFIPDRGSSKMHHWYRNTDRGDTKWNDLAPMKAVR